MTGHSIVSPRAAKHATNGMVMISIYIIGLYRYQYRYEYHITVMHICILIYHVSINCRQFIISINIIEYISICLKFEEYKMVRMKQSDNDVAAMQ